MIGHAGSAAHTDPVARALATAAGVLPDQGPIGVFVHHNPLHAFQHLPFHEGVQAGAAALGARPYLDLDEFQAALRSGRIDDADVRTEIRMALEALGDEAVVRGVRRSALWHALMVAPCDVDDAAGLAYTLRLGSAPQCQDLPLWKSCLGRLDAGPRPVWPDRRRFARHRDCLVALGVADADVSVNGELIRLGSGFLDHGHAHEPLPGREAGFLRAVCALYANGGAAPRACAGVDTDMRDVLARNLDAATIIRSAVSRLAVPDEEIEAFVFATAVALPGWAGMFARLERHPEEHVCEHPPTLAEFVAVRLLLERRAIARLCAASALPVSLTALRRRVPPPAPRAAILDAALLWWIAHHASLRPEDVALLSDAALRRLWDECLAFTPLRRRQLFQEAYERTYRRGILEALAVRRAMPSPPSPERARAQFVFCIDEREESIRRALEEQDPGYVTFGVAGFFGLAMDYRGLYDRASAAHCPVVVTPAHEIHEQPVYTELDWHELRTRLRDRWHGWELRAALSSRTLSGGAGLSLTLGPFAAAKTLAEVLAPRSVAAVAERVIGTMARRPATRLSTFRRADTDHGNRSASSAPHAHATAAIRKPLGFSLDEAADRVASVLRNIGLVHHFAPVVVFLGHGSTSLNNPHESAHDCGACGGRRGGANARLFADMANRPDVRAAVRQRGIDIPPDVWFIDALHDTADDNIAYYDLDTLPPSHAAPFDGVCRALDQARRHNALERSRRFDDAPLDGTPDLALAHVRARATLYAQPRPEYGHCTNALCIVGRRSVTRGLHLDRRAFLVSYDASTDPEGSIVERILAAVGPVGAGISLEYYFSAVDNETFGCGTKLPHNVTGLLGVMSGHQGDLRTGLPLQMVEIHEPMRLLLIVEATPASLLRVAERQPEVAELVVNGWVQLISMDPGTGRMAEFHDGGFEPYWPDMPRLPAVERSADWHMQSREHLPPALVRSALPSDPVSAGESVRDAAVVTHG